MAYNPYVDLPSIGGETAKGALGSAGTGAAIGSIGGPIGSAIGAGIGGLVGGITGLFGGRKKKAEALRKARMNAELSRIDTEFSPFVHQRSGIQAEGIPDVAGETIGGVFSGAMQGVNAYRGLQRARQDEQQANLINQLLQKEMDMGGLSLNGYRVAPPVDPELTKYFSGKTLGGTLSG